MPQDERLRVRECCDYCGSALLTILELMELWQYADAKRELRLLVARLPNCPKA